jgi:hypothetical protein
MDWAESGCGTTSLALRAKLQADIHSTYHLPPRSIAYTSLLHVGLHVLLMAYQGVAVNLYMPTLHDLDLVVALAPPRSAIEVLRMVGFGLVSAP